MRWWSQSGYAVCQVSERWRRSSQTFRRCQRDLFLKTSTWQAKGPDHLLGICVVGGKRQSVSETVLKEAMDLRPPAGDKRCRSERRSPEF